MNGVGSAILPYSLLVEIFVGLVPFRQSGFFKEAGVEVSASEELRLHDFFVKRNCCFDALDNELVQCAEHSFDGFFACRCMNNELSNH